MVERLEDRITPGVLPSPFPTPELAISYATAQGFAHPLLVRANAATRIYGSANPAFSASYTGFLPGDGPSALDGSLSLMTEATPASDIGSYDITPGGLSSSKYDVLFVEGILTVTPAPMIITPDAGQSRVYGAAMPLLTYTPSGLVNGDNATLLSGSIDTTATAASPVGNYAFTLGTLMSASANYTLTLADNSPSFAVTPAPLTITANNQSMVYGSAVLPDLTVDFIGFADGDNAASLTTQPTLSMSASASSHAGSYPINVTGAMDPNYNITFDAGTLSIRPAPLNISADNQTKVYGAPLPALTASFNGLVNGDTPAAFSIGPNVAPILATTATTSSDVAAGGYAITVSGAVDPDYNITYLNGTLSITPASQTILWSTPAAILVGTAVGSTQLNATVSVVGPAAAGSLTYSPPAGTVLAPGNGQVLTVTAAATNDYTAASASVAINVDYQFGGFQAPLSSNIALGLNRTVPIKFQLTEAQGNSVTSLSAVVSLKVLDIHGTDVLAGAGKSGLGVTGSQFRYSWQTKGLPAGTYTISLGLADGTFYTQVVQLSANGSSAALLVDGTVNSASVTGALLGGNVELYVDNSNGELTIDDVARIRDAATAVDAVTEPYGVTVEEVGDPGLANVTLTMGNTSAVGGYADGVLGCTRDAGQISIIQGWNFYAGGDATQVGSAQYDFQTVVTHELGHALGLGHSSDATSAMNATLVTGTARRALTVADLNVPDDGDTACGLHAAPILVSAIAGNDALTGGPGIIRLDAGLPLLARLFGDANALYELPGGKNVLVGGAGDDLLIGGHGRDLLIGGFGSDRLAGNGSIVQSLQVGSQDGTAEAMSADPGQDLFWADFHAGIT
jgi:hypothetical protein